MVIIVNGFEVVGVDAHAVCVCLIKELSRFAHVCLMWLIEIEFVAMHCRDHAHGTDRDTYHTAN